MKAEVEFLSKSYGGKPVVSDVSFGCPESSVTTLLGPNGAGKSTVMRMMAGLAVPERGQALYDGRPLTSYTRPSSVASFMLGPNHLPGSCSVQRFLKMNADAADLPPNMIPETLSVTGLQAASRKKIRHLSLGMRMRLAIGASLMTDPSLLVLDEPFNGLDPEGTAWLRGLIMHRTGQGKAVLISTHLLREAEAYTDQVVVLDNGEVRAQESVQRPNARVRCVPTDAARFRQALNASDVRYAEGEDRSFAVELKAEALLLLCNRERIDLVSIDLNAQGQLEGIFENALRATGAQTHA
ncbi:MULTISPECIES: ABC transporter ATP-binding protein [Micrococcaceae]|uniref:ABC transporter ATP-binding protein n=1 Tax=Micrococcaceae TaxID=1268 RepID=UPI0006849998|nr:MULTISPECIES: ATP-binding cassette domain-containing protein [Micrococcaceae]BCW56804.1 ABC transporter [Arthrobacter sp. StoSoilB20]